MAKSHAKQPKVAFVAVQFPLMGKVTIEEFQRQSVLSSADCINVWGFEALTSRSRGGSRSGLSKLIEDAVPDMS